MKKNTYHFAVIFNNGLELRLAHARSRACHHLAEGVAR